MAVTAPSWLSSGDNAWQMTAATLVGLMSVPGLVVLYGGVMQKRWSINSMMLAFAAFAVVLVVWVLWAFKMGFGHPIGHGTGFFSTFVGKPGPSLSHTELQHQANIPSIGTTAFPQSALVYFQFVFAAITPILMLGSVLGRVNFKAWIPFVALWCTVVYAVNAFLIWGGGFFGHHGAVDYSGGYVIHLSAGVSGFIAAAVIGPRLQRDREVDAPNNVAMVAVGAGLLWLGWNGFNGGDPYTANMSASAAILNTNLCTAVAFLIWVAWDYLTGRKPSLLSGVNGMITGLVAITPAAGYVNGWGAIALGVIASTLVYFALNYLSRLRPFRNVDDTLGVIYTHGFAGLAGGLLTGVFADPNMAITYNRVGNHLEAVGAKGLIHGNWVLLKWQTLAAVWVIGFSAIGTFVLLKFVGLFVPLRMSEQNMEIGDTAEHGHEVYPSDVPSLGFP
ncbi:MAG: ammonium transporter, partial [Solirubrobacterales bacterium]|nr:ammonium transporter [Solirubrobacterales bacterium]